MKQKYTILMLLSILIATVFFMWGGNLITGRMKRIKKIDKKIKGQQEKLNSAKVLNDQLQQVSKVIKNSITTEDHFSSEEVNGFVEQLAHIADEYKIAVTSVFPKSLFSSKYSLDQQFNLELQATYVQLGQFLSRLESLDYILTVKTLDIRPTSSSDEVTMEESNDKMYRVILELVSTKIKKEA